MEYVGPMLALFCDWLANDHPQTQLGERVQDEDVIVEKALTTDSFHFIKPDEIEACAPSELVPSLLGQHIV